MTIQAFLQELQSTVEQRTIVTDPDRIAPWLTDWRGRWTGRSAALLEPGSTKEVATIVRAAEGHGVALVLALHDSLAGREHDARIMGDGRELRSEVNRLNCGISSCRRTGVLRG